MYIRNLFLVLFCSGSLLGGSVSDGYSQKISNIDNPVLPGVADAGVIRYNGEYYIGGVFTDGSFYRSGDLVHWEGPFHVFSMANDWTQGPSAEDNRIHANDINYINGVFHQYWSVNYWGKDQHVVHIGHATSSDVLGPYEEPVKNTWLAGRIDAHLFRDDGRKLYLYMVKFTDGNTIWVRPMKDPGTFSGEPRYLFASLPGTWETLDNRVAEGPWAIQYRDQYYMIYNTNHTSTRWGNYAFGVAQADSPLGFNHGNKYPYPVVKSNQIDMEDRFVDLLKYSGKEPGTFLYTFDPPGKNWNEINFDASGWQRGEVGFGSTVVKNSTTRNVETRWQTPQMWMRKPFVLDKEDTGNLMLRIHHDGETQVFLNGQSIYEHAGRQYTTWNFDKKTASLLRDGKNVLAIHSTEGRRAGFLDVSLFDMEDQKGDDILYNPGQPNIVRGPNGLEWWLVYFAVKNGKPKSQFINRVHFFNKRLFVDGITGINTPGYHPEPARPTFRALFNDMDAGAWQNTWETGGGSWNIKNREVVQVSSSGARALIQSTPAAHYLFEAGVRMNNPEIARAGVYAWWQDNHNWLKVVLDQEHKKWAYILKEEGKTEAFSFPLPADFDYNAYHTLRIYKNAADFTVKIDGLPAPEHPVIEIPGFSGKGIPGLCTQGANTAFDGVLYTMGWDEFDENITGWGSSAKGMGEKGSWSVSEEGISPLNETGKSSIFKGDMLDYYEVGLQIKVESSEGRAGIYPVYIDAENYIKAVFDFEDQQFIVSGKRKGETMETHKVSLERSQSYYADMAYTDFIKKHFSFHTPAWINAIRFSRTPYNRPDTLIKDIYKKVNIIYKQEDKWHPLTTYREATSSHPGFDKITFDPVKAEALKLVNKQAEDFNFYTYKIWVNELFKNSYYLRVARRKEAIIFLVNGKVVLRMENNFPASQVGLFTDNIKAVFNGITLFHLPGKG